MAITDPSSGTTPALSGFLFLPIELRIEIYCYLLAPSVKDSYILYLRGWSELPNRQFHLHPAIIRANKQISFEATHILYSRNRFKIPFSGGFSNNLFPSWHSPMNMSRAGVIPD